MKAVRAHKYQKHFGDNMGKFFARGGLIPFDAMLECMTGGIGACTSDSQAGLVTEFL